MSDRIRPFGTWARRAVIGIALLALLLYPVLQPEAAYPQTVLLMAFLLAVMAMSWNIISGFAGYISLGHSAFLGLGAYTAGILSMRWGVNPLYLVPLGGLVAAATAGGVGAVVLRARGHAFVIITIALLFALQVCAVNFSGITNGSDGITLPLPAWPPRLQNIPFYYLFLALMLATFAFTAWIRRTKFGTGLVAIREDEGKAAAIGVSTTTYKILGYAASAVFIGMAGAVYAYFLTFLNPVGAFSILVSVTIVLAALVGGRGTIWGPLIGAFIVQILSEVATVQAGGSGSRLLLLGLALMLVVLFPGGCCRPGRAAGPPPDLPRWVLRAAALTAPDRGCTTGCRRPSAHRPSTAGDPRSSPRFSGLTASTGGPERGRGASPACRTEQLGQDHVVQPRHRCDRADRVVLFDGERIDRMPPWRRAWLGRTCDWLFGRMTVLGTSSRRCRTSAGTLAADAVTRGCVPKLLEPSGSPGSPTRRRHAVLRPAKLVGSRSAHAATAVLLDEPAGEVSRSGGTDRRHRPGLNAQGWRSGVSRRIPLVLSATRSRCSARDG
jgi:branched-chain amino acid transport system permease protein